MKEDETIIPFWPYTRERLEKIDAFFKRIATKWRLIWNR